MHFGPMDFVLAAGVRSMLVCGEWLEEITFVFEPAVNH